MEWIAGLLHAGTLLLVNALLASLASALFFALYMGHPRVKRQPGVMLWGTSYAAFAAGFGVLFLPAFHVGFPGLGLVGNLLIDLGAVWALLAVNAYLELPRRRLWVLVPVAAMALAELFLVLVEGENLRHMVILGGALTALLTGATGAAFWQCKDEAQRPVARLAALFHFLWAAMLLVRMSWWIAQPVEFAGRDPTSTFGLLSRIVLTWVITPSLLWMLTRKLDAELIRHASQDPLTGVANRRVMWEEGQQRIAASTPRGSSVATLIIDVDRFKSINDRWGHDGGDQVLVAIADTLRRHIREKDILARVGGEEFMVLLHQAEATAAKDAAERLRLAIEKEAITLLSGETLHCTVSIGYCVSTRREKSWREVVVAADQALYAAKQAGRNRVVGTGD
ncbi:diguanylate cyclase (GGDEF) domain-containing protein [Dyella jiangningensis]|uniref:GGDEF domain-containing protein n=1 Tax=Dyella sp. AtDHG13 TaxID=1938897 RepID=UPI00087E1778|nr:GGDEF domain-containing protein [Dyella sp. AtDHG13]PXV55914.1 diguanylate cyclase (GGDEF)-like protein [Dyella sp. AtDHG13]SDK51071.1 diguanylate cyclase (GGDEF) domain-containing protein [Dyella jiangningensis]